VALRTDDHLKLAIPGTTGAPKDGVEVRVLDARNTDNLRVMQTLQVMDGGSAYIQTGQSAPVPQQHVTRTVVGGRVVEQVVDSVEYRSVGTGFYVLPRVTGDRVTLDLSPYREALTQRVPGMADVQRVVTTVSGRLGEWLDVGGMTEQRSTEREALLGRTTATRSEQRNIVVKVEELR
jgi:type II secretory pathway component GspD/PulD (secretin)